MKINRSIRCPFLRLNMTRFKFRLGPFTALICLFIAAVLIRNSGYLILLLLFAAFAVHELGHISFGGLIGYQAFELKITPLGGCLAMDPLLQINPEAELLIAAAGPMMNLIMVGGVFYLGILGVSHEYLDRWQQINLLIGVINLVPALPLDGGRIFHAFLSGRFGERSANITVKRITGAVALISLGLGLYQIIIRQGGLFFILLSGLTFTQLWQSHAPGLNLSWQLWQRKQKILREKGFLPVKPILVTDTSPIHSRLHQCGSGDGLLFLVTGKDPKLTFVTEEQAWEAMIANGIKATFRETMK